MREPTRSATYLLLAVIALIPPVMRLVFLRGFYSDDPFIIFVHARNLVEHGILSFNLSDPVLGVTCPLWTLLLALGCFLPFPIYVSASFLGCAAASVSVALMFMLLKQRTQSNVLSLCGAFLLATDCWLMRWAGTGMETAAGVLMVVVFLWCLWTMRPTTARSIALGACSGVAWMIRPECALLVLLAILDPLLQDRRNVRGSLLAAGCALAVTSPWIVYALHTYGTILPNTVAVKQAGLRDVPGLINACRRTAGILGPSRIFEIGIIAVLGVVAFRRKRTSMLRTVAPMLVLAAVFVMHYIVTTVPVISRYFLPLAPVWIAAAILLLYAGPGSNKPKAALWLCVLAGVLNVSFFFQIIVPNARIVTEDLQGVYRRVGEWLYLNSPQDATVALNDIGIIGYYARREVIDLVGLVTPEVQGTHRMEYLMEKRPDYALFKYRVDQPQPRPSTRDLVAGWDTLLDETVRGQGITQQHAVRMVLYRCRWGQEPPAGPGALR